MERMRQQALPVARSAPAFQPARYRDQGEPKGASAGSRVTVRCAWVQPSENGSSNGNSSYRDRAARVQRDVYRVTAGGGVPLPENTRTAMEHAFSADFSRVRVHTDAAADGAAVGRVCVNFVGPLRLRW
jgi:Domain of unknown function (DUF4157)